MGYRQEEDPYAATGPNFAQPDWIPEYYIEKGKGSGLSGIMAEIGLDLLLICWVNFSSRNANEEQLWIYVKQYSM